MSAINDLRLGRPEIGRLNQKKTPAKRAGAFFALAGVRPPVKRLSS